MPPVTNTPAATKSEFHAAAIARMAEVMPRMAVIGSALLRLEGLGAHAAPDAGGGGGMLVGREHCAAAPMAERVLHLLERVQVRAAGYGYILADGHLSISSLRRAWGPG